MVGSVNTLLVVLAVSGGAREFEGRLKLHPTTRTVPYIAQIVQPKFVLC